MSTPLRSTRYTTVPEHLAGRVLIHGVNRSAPAVGTEQRLVTLVPVGGGSSEPIGHVEKRRTETWRKVGRIRTSLVGRPVHWEAYDSPTHRVGYRYGSMAAAVLALALHHQPTEGTSE